MIKIIQNLTISSFSCVKIEFTQLYCLIQTHGRLTNQQITPTSKCYELSGMNQMSKKLQIYFVFAANDVTSYFCPRCTYNTIKSLQNSQLASKFPVCAIEEKTHSFLSL